MRKKQTYRGFRRNLARQLAKKTKTKFRVVWARMRREDR
jgi:hypothetical protein